MIQEAVIEYRILGPLEVMGEDGPVALGGQKQRGLLALLLVHAGTVVASERLVTYLWGETPPKTAATALQNLVGQLRKLLGSDAIETKPPGYVLQVEPDRFDLARFEQLCAAARKAGAEERAGLLREALALWRGPALADLAFETFAQNEIRRLEELRLDAVENRIDADLELGGAGDLVGELESLVDQFPLRERLRSQLMLALYRAGRQADALECYHEARRALVDELGIEPSPGLQQVYTSILRQETGLEAAPSEASPEDHLAEALRALFAGRLVPVLGPGVNLAPLPDATSVAARLAEQFDCPADRGPELARVAEYAALTQGIGPLYDELHALLDRDLEPGPVHQLLAGIADLLGAQNQPRQLIVTTNFDTALERALEERGADTDVVSYLALGGYGGKFVHVRPDGAATVIDLPNAYTALSLEERTIILKIHGQVDRGPAREWESFVVAEDDHIDYLAGADIASVVPVTLAAKLRRSHFLFLGYPLEDWSLRVFLHRVWGRERVSYRSWAVVPGAGRIECEHWRRRGIEVVDAPLDEYAAAFERRLAEVAV